MVVLDYKLVYNIIYIIIITDIHVIHHNTYFIEASYIFFLWTTISLTYTFFMEL